MPVFGITAGILTGLQVSNEIDQANEAKKERIRQQAQQASLLEQEQFNQRKKEQQKRLVEAQAESTAKIAEKRAFGVQGSSLNASLGVVGGNGKGSILGGDSVSLGTTYTGKK